MKAVIRYTDLYIPEDYLTIREYVKMLEDSFLQAIGMSRDDLASVLENSIGIEKIYIEDRKNEAKLFGEMLEEYFAGDRVSPEEIDYIIYTRGNSLAAGNPWSMTDTECINVPYFLQKEFKMSNAQVFNVEQVCTGTMVAMRIAISLIGEGAARRILVLSGNFFQRPENRLMGGLGLVSDGLGIMEISRGDSGLALIDFASVTDGSITMVKDFRKGTIPADIVNTGSDLIKSLVRDNGLTIKDISLIIPQNISGSGWNFYCQVLDFPRERVFLETFSDGGHMGDVDIIRNLTGVLKKKLVPKNGYAIIYGLGTGTSWSALLLQAL